MKLYLVRHGEAVGSDIDPQRPLSDRGRRDVQRIADFLKPVNLCVGLIWHSEKTRSVQTAEILADSVASQKGCLPRDGLAPNDDVSEVKLKLELLEEDIMIVGHLPFLGKLVSLLLTGSESPQMAGFAAGGIICLTDSKDNAWQIDWAVSPELLP